MSFRNLALYIESKYNMDTESAETILYAALRDKKIFKRGSDILLDNNFKVIQKARENKPIKPELKKWTFIVPDQEKKLIIDRMNTMPDVDVDVDLFCFCIAILWDTIAKDIARLPESFRREGDYVSLTFSLYYAYIAISWIVNIPYTDFREMMSSRCISADHLDQVTDQTWFLMHNRQIKLAPLGLSTYITHLHPKKMSTLPTWIANIKKYGEACPIFQIDEHDQLIDELIRTAQSSGSDGIRQLIENFNKRH